MDALLATLNSMVLMIQNTPGLGHIFNATMRQHIWASVTCYSTKTGPLDNLLS